MKRDFSMSQIAEMSGVSISTVSRVLNDRPGVDPEKRERVLETVRSTGFVRSMSAQALSTNKTRMIGVVSHKQELPRFLVSSSDILTGVHDEARRDEFHILTTMLTDGEMTRNEPLSMVREGRIDGLVVIGPVPDPAFVVAQYNTGIPMVLVDSMLENTSVDCVLHENTEPVYELTSHLIATGRQHILFLSGPSDWISSRERARGYKAALAENGLTPTIVHMANTTIETGREAMEEVLSADTSLDAIVAVNDATAIGAARLCKERGIRIPEDIAITGYDDIQWAEYHDPPLTTVRAYPYQMGRLALRRVIDLITETHDDAKVRVRLRVQAQPIYRASSG